MVKVRAADPALAAAVGFERVLPDWRALGETARYYYQTPHWIACLSRHLDDAVFVTFADGQRPVAVSMLRRSRKRWGVNFDILFGPGYLETFRLGADGLLASDADDRYSFDEIMSHLSPWHAVRLSRLRPGSPWLRLAGVSAHVEEEPEGGVGVLDTNRAADEWRRVMPGNIRDSIKKTQRKADREGGSEVAVLTGEGVARGFEQFMQLEASGWKGRSKTDLCHKPAWRSLLLDYLLGSDTAEVRCLNIDGRIAAAQLSVRVDRTLFLLKIAYDEQLAHLSPGNILMANLVEVCCEDPNVDRIDCTVWQPWHQRWGMVREPTFRLTAFNSRSVRGALAGTVWNATPTMVAGQVLKMKRALARWRQVT
jgi:hypothetical protein